MLSVCGHGALAVRSQEVLADLAALFASLAGIRNCTQTDGKRSMRRARRLTNIVLLMAARHWLHRKRYGARPMGRITRFLAQTVVVVGSG